MDQTANLHIGSLIFDVKAHQMILGDTTTQVEPKVMEVIQYFYSKKNQVVSRENLLTAVWQDQVVSDNAISRSVSQFRKLLELDDKKVANIETIPRVGYRLNVSSVAVKEINSFSLKDIPFDMTMFKVASFVLFSLILFAHYFYEKLNPPIAIEEIVIENITELPGVERNPKLSPNGERLAFSYRHRDRVASHLYLVNPLDKKAYPVLEDEQILLDFAWSPDSGALLLSRWNNRSERKCEISLLTLNNSYQLLNKEKLIDCGARASTYLVWHPNGDKFYFNDRESLDRPYSVFSYSLVSKRKTQLTLPPQDGNARGDYLLFSGTGGDQLGIVRYRATHDHQLNIYNMTDDSLVSQQYLDPAIGELDWFGNSNDLLIKQEDKLYRFDPEIQSKELVYPVGKATGYYNVAENGDRIFFVSGQADRNIVSYLLNSPITPTLLTQSTAFEQRPSFANLSQAIAYFSDQTGKNQIWLRDAQGNHKKLSDSPASLGSTHLSWSPDDRFILFEFSDEIFSIDSVSGEIKRLIDRPHKAYVARWSKDGNSIFYSSEKSGEWQIWQFNLQSGQHSQLTSQGGYTPAQASDGMVYFSKLHEAGLWKVKIEDPPAEAELVIDDFEVINWMSWQLTDRGVYYVRNKQNNTGIYFFDFKTREITKVMDRLPNHSTTFSVKDDQILLTVQSSAESKIQMIRLR